MMAHKPDLKKGEDMIVSRKIDWHIVVVMYQIKLVE